MTGWRKVCLVAVAVVGVAAAVGLVVLVIIADLETAAAAGSVVGAVTGLASAGLSVWALLGFASTTVFASGGSNAAGRDMHNPRARATGPGSGPSTAPGPGVSASGGSNAAGRDMNDPTAQGQ
ncbi:hypothetical protein [Embleya hyalina]|uniref:Uncharacterized protein n=1 Tax=Embleya hyalina TaxID=516124 RepID=A0A401YYZ2_9ACTN|nr:hypothetical protein [Embleya hyalina]GCD99770.1 hypothetical protein EHYA_07492 [Embleya hyalina]